MARTCTATTGVDPGFDEAPAGDEIRGSSDASTVSGKIPVDESIDDGRRFVDLGDRHGHGFLPPGARSTVRVGRELRAAQYF